MSKKLLALLLTLVMLVSVMPMSVFATGETPSGTPNVAKIGTTEYATLKDAIDAAKSGDVVEIIKADTYSVPGISNNITIKGAETLKENGVPTVVFNCVGSGSIASIPNGATFENVTMNFGTSNYHGFQHAGTINMNNCTLNGLFFSYGDMNFNGCTFNAPGGEYSMWCYAGNITYMNCTVNCAGKFANVYNEGNGTWSVRAEGCTFNSTKANKAALNVKENCCNGEELHFDIKVKNCSATGLWPTAKGDDTSTLLVINALVQIDDRNASTIAKSKAGNGVKVTINDSVVYPAAAEEPTPVNPVQPVPVAPNTERGIDDAVVAAVMENEAVNNFTVTNLASALKESTDEAEKLSIKFELLTAKADDQTEGTAFLKFDVKPYANENVISNDKLNGSPITFRLPLTSAFDNVTVVKVIHHATNNEVSYYAVQGDVGAKYVEITTTSFSEFDVVATNLEDVPVLPVAAVGKVDRTTGKLTGKLFGDTEEKTYTIEELKAYATESEGRIELPESLPETYPVFDVSKGFNISWEAFENAIGGENCVFPTVPANEFVFAADQMEETNYYDDWYVDFTVSINDSVAKDSMGLVGYYSQYELPVGFFAPMSFEAGQQLPLLNSVQMTSGWRYSDIKNTVKTFVCGAFNTSKDNIGKTLKVQLRIFDPEVFTDPDLICAGGWKDGENSFVINEILYEFTEDNLTTIVEGDGTTYSYAGIADTEETIPAGAYYVDGFMTEARGEEEAVSQPTAYFEKVEYVARIGDKKYETLAEAIAAVPTNGTETTITMIGDETIDVGSSGKGIVIPAGVKLTLELAGHKIVGYDKAGGQYHVLIEIANGAEVVINDSSSPSTGLIQFNEDPAGNKGAASAVIDNHGKLTLEAGTIENTSTDQNTALEAAVDDHANEWGTYYNGNTEFIMNGGTLKTVNNNTLRLYDSSQTGSGEVHIVATINGGTIIGKDTAFLMAQWTNNYVVGDNDPIVWMNPLELNINGGTFESINGIRVTGNPGEFNNQNYKAIKINIKDGVNLGTQAGDKYYKYDVAFQETAGWQSTEEATAMLRSYAEINGKPAYKAPVAKIGDVKYETLADAIAAANELGKAEIVMIADTSITFDTATYAQVNSGSNITLDLNGKVIKSAATNGSTSQLINNLGTLTIKDSAANDSDGHYTGKIIHGANPAWVYDGSGSYNGSYASNLILNYGGTVKIESGHLENASSSSAAYVVDNNNNVANGATTLTINGGELVAAWTAIRQFVQRTDKENNVIVNGGTISAGRNCFVLNASALNLAKLTINNGVFTVNKNGVSGTSAPIQLWQDNIATTKMSIFVNGGCFAAKGGAKQQIVELDFSKASEGEAKKAINISGGYFNLNDSSLTDYIADGKTVIDTPDGAEKAAGYIYTIGLAPVAPSVDEKAATESEKAVDVPEGAETGLAQKVVDVVISEITGNTAVSAEGASNIQSGDVENKLKEQITGLVDSSSQLKITVKSVASTTEETQITAINATTVTTTSAKYDVKPYVTIETTDESGKTTTKTRQITNDELAAAKVTITFRLAVPKSMKSDYVEVKHYETVASEGTLLGTFKVLGSDSNRYVEISASSFSVYEIIRSEEETFVAVNDKTKLAYNSAFEALEAAKSGETVYLVANATSANETILNDGEDPAIDDAAQYHIIKPGVKFDLNGYDLESTGVIVFGGVLMDDSVGHTSKLHVGINGLTYSNSSKEVKAYKDNGGTSVSDQATGYVLPVWNPDESTEKADDGWYTFYQIKDVWQQWADNGTTNPKYRFAPDSDGNAAIKAILAANSGIGLKVTVSYSRASSQITSDYIIAPGTVEAYRDSANPSTGCMYIKFNGTVTWISAKTYIIAKNCNFCVVGNEIKAGN